MKVAYTPELILKSVKHLDVRAQKLSDATLSIVIDDAYAEMGTVVQAFSDEEVVNLEPYYINGERKLTLEIEEDVTDVYDVYLTVEDETSSHEHGIKKIRDIEAIYKDNRHNGIVHVNLDKTKDVCDNAVIKYYYTPASTTETVYMDAQTWIAFKSALGVALYDYIKDVEKNSQKRAEMTRRCRAIMPSMPEDATDPHEGHIFAGLET